LRCVRVDERHGVAGEGGAGAGAIPRRKRTGDHLSRALELGRLCSNDPACATDQPNEDRAERYLEGAACHGCLYLAEVSCERMNRMLDRALFVPVNRPAARAGVLRCRGVSRDVWEVSTAQLTGAAHRR
jgi:hypothetical protein